MSWYDGMFTATPGVSLGYYNVPDLLIAVNGGTTPEDTTGFVTQRTQD